MNVRYPRPASNASAFITSQATTVTAGATTVAGYNTTPPYAVDVVKFNVAGDPCRVLWEGSTPGATTGHLVVAGIFYEWPTVQYNNAKFCFATGSTASVITASPFTVG